MQLTIESLENFKRAIIGDALMGVLDTVSDNIYLALVKPRLDSPEITEDRHSVIMGEKLTPLDNNGGHTSLAARVGISNYLTQAKAVGFTIKKTAVNSYQMLSICSALNYKFMIEDYPRPTGPLLETSANRTMPESFYQEIILVLDAAISAVK